jgi:pilus assembly protein Flp/PilA
MELEMNHLIERLSVAAVWLKAEEKRGVSAIEYGLLAALIALVIIGSIMSLGSSLQSVFSNIATSI